MRKAVVSAALAVAALAVAALVAPAPAAAAPSVDLGDCAVFDAATLAAAIDRELPPVTAAAASPYRIVALCTLENAWLHVEPVRNGRPIALVVKLDEVPPELRVKLLALAIADLAQVVVALPGGESVAGDAAEVPTAYLHPPPPSFAIALRVGARVLPVHAARAFAIVGLETNPGRMRFGVQGVFDHDAQTGSATLVISAATFGYDVYCRHDATSSLCITPRVETGFTCDSLYFELGVGVDVEHRVEGVRLAAGIVAGWEHPGALDNGISPGVIGVGPALDVVVGARW